MKALLRAAVFAAIATAAPAALAVGAVPPGSDDGPSAVSLARLPAGHDELVFRGEANTRVWDVVLSPAEASRIANMQLAMLTSVVTLPDRSTLKLTINGRSIARIPVQSSDKLARTRVRIPAGVLNGGVNHVEIDVALTHRVDCSIKATYELWALLDPAQTGFVIDAAAGNSIRTLDELAIEPLAEDGATHIHLQLPDSPEPEAVARYARFVAAVVRRGRLPNPIVDASPAPAKGPGIDMELTTRDAPRAAADTLRVLGRDAEVTIGRRADANRLTLALAAENAQDLDAKLSALETTVASDEGADIAKDFRGDDVKTFADLGFYTDGFSGRRYVSGANVNLPADFFPGNYDSAVMLIDGSHSAALDRDSELVFRVNGEIVSSLPLAAGRAESFDRRQIDLPLRYFHPGHNEVVIDGATSSPLDRQCDVEAISREKRLEIVGTSELRMPHLARLATSPRIPSGVSAGGPDKGRTHLYLPDLGANSIGAALTAYANLAPTLAANRGLELHVAMPAQSDPPGLVVAALDQLPPELSNSVVRRLRSAGSGKPMVREPSASPAWLPKSVARGGWFGWMVESLSRAGRVIEGDDAASLATSEHYLLAAAVSGHPDAPTQRGLRWPRFVTDASQWLVLTSAKAADLDAGLDKFVANSGWSKLSGVEASYDVETGELKSVEPAHTVYLVPGVASLWDLRPIAGGIMSDYIALSLGGFVILIGALGLSTHRLIRRTNGR